MKTRSILTLLLSLGFCVGAAEAKGQKGGLKSRDTNGDKILSRDEFMAHRRHPEKAARHFEKADSNRDGQLDKSERATLKTHGRKHHAGKRMHKRNG